MAPSLTFLRKRASRRNSGRAWELVSTTMMGTASSIFSLPTTTCPIRSSTTSRAKLLKRLPWMPAWLIRKTAKPFQGWERSFAISITTACPTSGTRPPNSRLFPCSTIAAAASLLMSRAAVAWRVLPWKCPGGPTGSRTLITMAGRTCSYRMGIGAQLKVTTEDGDSQYDMVSTSAGYGASRDPRAHFGLGPSKTVKQLLVRWPSGVRQVLKDLPADQIHRIVEP